MTRAEALRILELNNNANIDEIKSAYSEKIKDCHPEDDPEGFKNYHDAFSLLHKEYRRNARNLTSKTSEIKEEKYEKVETVEVENEEDEITKIVKANVDTELDIFSDEEEYEYDYVDPEKRKLIEDAIDYTQELYESALNNKIYNSHYCMKDMFKKYSTDTYFSKDYMNSIAVMLDDDNLDDSVFGDIAKYYNFLKDNKYITDIKSERLKLFRLVEKRWKPLDHGVGFIVSLFVGIIIIFCFGLIEMIFDFHMGSEFEGVTTAVIVGICFTYFEMQKIFRKEICRMAAHFLISLIVGLVAVFEWSSLTWVPLKIKLLFLILLVAGNLIVAVLYYIKLRIKMRQ